MDKKTRKIAAIAAIVSILMFSFSFALSPLYRVLCKKTGLNGGVNADEVKENKTAHTLNSAQPILVQFVTTTNAGLPWDFRPEKNSVRVLPGQTIRVSFRVKNNSGQRMTVQAIPSFAPPAAAQYFHKIECFCFTQQTLAANETKLMPVVFRIDQALPNNINTISLSYTLFAVPKKE